VNALEYREKAADCVAVAATLGDRKLRAEVLALGQVWLRLAEQADRNTSKPYGHPVPRRPG
jgi:hypothetical protein